MQPEQVLANYRPEKCVTFRRLIALIDNRQLSSAVICLPAAKLRQLQLTSIKGSRDRGAQRKPVPPQPLTVSGWWAIAALPLLPYHRTRAVIWILLLSSPYCWRGDFVQRCCLFPHGRADCHGHTLTRLRGKIQTLAQMAELTKNWHNTDRVIALTKPLCVGLNGGVWRVTKLSPLLVVPSRTFCP